MRRLLLPAALLLCAVPVWLLLAPSKDEASQGAETAAPLSTDAWPTEPAYTYTFNALDPLAGSSSSTSAQSLYDPNDDYWGLPRTAGFELVGGYCSACHSLEIVMQQRASAQRWAYMLKWMSEEQNMPPLPADEEVIVLSYLTEHFGSE